MALLAPTIKFELGEEAGAGGGGRNQQIELVVAAERGVRGLQVEVGGVEGAFRSQGVEEGIPAL